MSDERCEVCDREACPVIPFRRMDYVEFDETAGIPGDEKYEAFLALDRDCEAHKQDWRARALFAESKLATLPATAALPEPTGEREVIEQVATWLETCVQFRKDDGTNAYERAWNNARHDAARQLRNGNWRKVKP